MSTRGVEPAGVQVQRRYSLPQVWCIIKANKQELILINSLTTTHDFTFGDNTSNQNNAASTLSEESSDEVSHLLLGMIKPGG